MHMRVVLTTVRPELDSDLDPRFGRGAYFLVVDAVTLEYTAHPNPGVAAASGAGAQAAQFVASQKADAVISHEFGPHAVEVLKAASTSTYLNGSCRTAREAVAAFRAGTLERVETPTGAGRHR
jgi:predicted Fe-Mo cluster-binding NifX family protein